MKFIKTISLILLVAFFITQSSFVHAQVRTKPQAVITNKTPVGYLDEVTSAGIARGWAYDPDTSTTSIPVHFYIDKPAGNVDSLAGDTTANLVRSDVNSTVKISGNHGFEFSIPSKYRDGKQHTVYAYGIDTSNVGSANKQLTNVKTFTLQPSFVAPVITALSQSTVPASTTVTVFGTGFLPGQSYTAKITSAVDGKVLANVTTTNTSAKGTEVSFVVPSGIYGNSKVAITFLNLTTSYYNETNALPFTITAPVVPPVTNTKPVVVAASTPTISELDSFDQNSATVTEKHLTATFNLSITAGSDDMQFSSASSSFGFKVFRNGVVTTIPNNIVTIYYPSTKPSGAINYSMNGFTVPKNKTVIIPITYKIDAAGTNLSNGSFPSGNYSIQLSNYIFTAGDSFIMSLNNIQTSEVVSQGGDVQSTLKITSLNVPSAYPGDTVIINGSGFSTSTRNFVNLNNSNNDTGPTSINVINQSQISFIVPILTPGVFAVSVETNNARSNYVSLTILSASSSVPTVTIINEPKLTLQYDSNKKESSLYGSQSFTITAGTKDFLLVGAPFILTEQTGVTAPKGYFPNGTSFTILASSTNVIQENGQWKVKAGQTATFVSSFKANPDLMYAGVYNARLDGSIIIFVDNQYKTIKVSDIRESRNVTLVGESIKSTNASSTTATSTAKKISFSTELVNNLASSIQGIINLFKTQLP